MGRQNVLLAAIERRAAAASAAAQNTNARRRQERGKQSDRNDSERLRTTEEEAWKPRPSERGKQSDGENSERLGTAGEEARTKEERATEDEGAILGDQLGLIPPEVLELEPGTPQAKVQASVLLLSNRVDTAGSIIALKTLKTVVGNILANPAEEKFQRLKTTNKRLRAAVLEREGGLDFLQAVGFARKAQQPAAAAAFVYERNDPGLLWFAKELLGQQLQALGQQGQGQQGPHSL